MSNWDLMMPGMGLTSIGLAGVVLAYADIAHTFIDGLHALAGLTMFIGLIILAVGILDGGISTSNRAKATVLVIVSIALGFGTYAFTFNTVSTSSTFAGILMAIAAPATIIAYVSAKHTKFLKPVAAIFILGSVAGIAAFVGFGLVGPSPYLIQEGVPAVDEGDGEAEVAAVSEASVLVSIPDGAGIASADQIYYDPEIVEVASGSIISWTNDDVAAHTVTSGSPSTGPTDLFDSGIMAGGDVYEAAFEESGEYEYFCLLHPFMIGTVIVE